MADFKKEDLTEQDVIDWVIRQPLVCIGDGLRVSVGAIMPLEALANAALAEKRKGGDLNG